MPWKRDENLKVSIREVVSTLITTLQPPLFALLCVAFCSGLHAWGAARWGEEEKLR